MLASSEQLASTHLKAEAEVAEQLRVRQEELSRTRAQVHTYPQSLTHSLTFHPAWQVSSLSIELTAEKKTTEKLRSQLTLTRAEATRYQTQVYTSVTVWWGRQASSLARCVCVCVCVSRCPVCREQRHCVPLEHQIKPPSASPTSLLPPPPSTDLASPTREALTSFTRGVMLGRRKATSLTYDYSCIIVLYKMAEASASVDDAKEGAQSLLEREGAMGGPQFNPPLYRQRYEAVIAACRRLNAAKVYTPLAPDLAVPYTRPQVVDVGCAECKLLRLLLRRVDSVQELVGVDIDTSLLEAQSSRLQPLITDYVLPRETPLTIRLMQGILIATSVEAMCSMLALL